MACRRLNTSGTSRDRVRRLYMHCESCEHTACVRRRCRPSSSQSVANIAQLLYASSAWSGFIKAIDRQRVDGFLCRNVSHGYCSPDVPTFAEQCATADEQYFEKICGNSNHMLHRLLPPPSTASQNYNLRSQVQSTATATLCLIDCNFVYVCYTPTYTESFSIRTTNY